MTNFAGEKHFATRVPAYEAGGNLSGAMLLHPDLLGAPA